MVTGYKSRIGEILRERRMPVSELQRRLRERGTAVSRGALDHLVAVRPGNKTLRRVDLRILCSILDELNIDHREALVPVSEETISVPSFASVRPLVEELAARHAAKAQLQSRRVATGAAREAITDMSAGLLSELQSHHPEVFDMRGRLRKRRLADVIRERLGPELTSEGLLELSGPSQTRPLNC